MGITSFERPFRQGYLNQRLNKMLKSKWLDVDDGPYQEYIGFIDPTDHWDAVDDVPEEFPDGRTKHRRKRPYK